LVRVLRYLDATILVSLILASVAETLFRYGALTEILVSIVGSAMSLVLIKGLRKNMGNQKAVLIRKVPHIVGGLSIAALVASDKLPLAVALTQAAALSFLAVIILDKSKMGGIVSSLASTFGLVQGTGEQAAALSTPFYAFMGFSIAYLIPIRLAVVAAVLSLTVGDTLAAAVGTHGRIALRTNGKKTLEGSAAMFLSNFAITYALSLSPVKSAAVAAVTTLLEASNFPPDDNFVIPVAAAIVYALV
jgi:dolichol kinase